MQDNDVAYIESLPVPAIDPVVEDAQRLVEKLALSLHDLSAACDRVDTEPTPAQAEAGNYRKGHVRWKGLPLTIENPAGSIRRGVNKGGKKWSTKMKHSYGYIKRTTSETDGDHLDIFLNHDGLDHEIVFVINQVDPETGDFDEHKTMLGFSSAETAKDGYLANYEKGWKGCGTVVALTLPQFRWWSTNGDTSREITDDFATRRKAAGDDGEPGAIGLPDITHCGRTDTDYTRQATGNGAIPVPGYEERRGGAWPYHAGHDVGISSGGVTGNHQGAPDGDSGIKAAGHDAVRDGYTYDIDRLIARVAALEPERIVLSSVSGINRSRRTGFSKKRYEEADPSFAGIVDDDLRLWDGRHRAAKLLDQGETHGLFRRATPADIAAVKISEDDHGHRVGEIVSAPDRDPQFAATNGELADAHVPAVGTVDHHDPLHGHLQDVSAAQDADDPRARGPGHVIGSCGHIVHQCRCHATKLLRGYVAYACSDCGGPLFGIPEHEPGGELHAEPVRGDAQQGIDQAGRGGPGMGHGADDAIAEPDRQHDLDPRKHAEQGTEPVLPGLDKGPIPGLPDRSHFGDLSQLRPGQIHDLIVQHHHAERAGPHFDWRIGSPETGLFSWATKKEKPAPGGRIGLFQQPLHSHSYGGFEGIIPSGYGAGTVRTHTKGKILVTKVEPDAIHFATAHNRHPERFVITRISEDPKNWLLINTTPTKPLPYQKIRYTKIPREKIEPALAAIQPGTSVQAKIDGASSLSKLMRNGVELVSYRTAGNSGYPITHRERFFGSAQAPLEIPREHVGSVLRGELYGVQNRDGKETVIPAHQLGAILNSSIANAIAKQQNEHVTLRNAIFDIQQHGNTPIDFSTTPYSERRALLEKILPHLPADKFHLSHEVKTPEEALALWKSISGGTHPHTREGVVIHPPTGKPSKAKIFDDYDVHVAGTFPGEGRRASTVGGLTYSLEPGGPIAGKVGTGFSDELLNEIAAEPGAYIGRVARIRSQEQLPSGAYRAPAFIAFHEDLPEAAVQEEKQAEEFIPEAYFCEGADCLLPETKRADLLTDVPLQPHQKEVADTGNEPEKKILLYHSLGSGKTRSAISAAETAHDPYTAIVPASLRPNLRGEQHKWTDETLPNKVVSYNAVARGQVQPSDTLIFDEAQKLRNPNSLTTQNAVALADKARHVYLLSGTPIVNHPHDLVPMIRMLTGKQYDPDEFDRHFIDERKISPGFWGWLNGVKPVTVPAMKNQQEFDNLMRGHVHYHAPDKPDVEQLNEHYTTELSPEQTSLYKGFWGQLPWMFRWKLQHDFPLTKEEMLRLSSFLSGPRQVSLSTYPFMKGNADAYRAYQQSPKLNTAVKLMREALDKDPEMRGVAFSNFIDAGLTPYAAALEHEKIPYGIFHGGLNDAARKKAVEDYNTGKTRVLLLGPSGSEGISLKGTRLLQILDPHWNSARSTQAIGRGIRYDSHVGLPIDERNVRVQRFASHMPRSGWQKLWRTVFGIKEHKNDPRREAPGVDYYLEQMARRKDRINEVFEDELKRLGSEKQSTDMLDPGLHESAGSGLADCLCEALAGTTQGDGAGVLRLRNDRDGGPVSAEPGSAGGSREESSNGNYRPFLIIIQRTVISSVPDDEPDPENSPFTVAVDLDGTLAEKQNPFDPETIGEPRKGARKWLRKFQDAGARIIIFTVRGNRDLVAEWLEENDIPFDYINENPDQPRDGSGKVYADCYWDDKAITADDLDESGPAILDMIHEKSAEDAVLVSAEDLLSVLEEAV